MSVFSTGSGIQGAYTPLMAGGKIGGNAGKTPAADDRSFTSVFKDAVQEIAEADAQKATDSYNLAVGDIDNLAALMTNAERAQTAFQLLVQMRNKMLDSYSEIMRMNI